MKWNFECESERRDYLHDTYRCAVKRFCLDQQICIADSFDSITDRVGRNSRRGRQPLHRIFNSETIIARALKYSVSHFIDCHPVARRLSHR